MKTTSASGVQIAYDVQGKGPCVLLLHGFGNDRRMWADYGWIAKLSGRLKVITMDFRGCGDSDRPVLPSAYSVECHLQDIEAVTAACDVDRPMVWGWSLGATLALHFAASGKAQATVAAGTYFGPIFTPAFVQAGIAKATGDVDRARLKGMGAWPEVQPVQIQGRLLVYTGTNDGKVLRQLELQRQSIEAAGGELRVLENCNHLELVSETDKVVKVVESFFHKMC